MRAESPNRKKSPLLIGVMAATVAVAKFLYSNRKNKLEPRLEALERRLETEHRPGVDWQTGYAEALASPPGESTLIMSPKFNNERHAYVAASVLATVFDRATNPDSN